MYKVFPTRLDNFLDALGVEWVRPWRKVKPRQFWAVRDIDLELKRGSRLGIIGRNGAGKSTLLKIITGKINATEGELFVYGKIQALLETGAGFHPEFTGLENIRASLTYQGFGVEEIEEAIQDIAEFTELGQFLNQPFKTYSSGMQARLTFATATVLKPDILIIDEILGAGDAYFAGKSNERMKQLVEESGASVLLVSHSMEAIIRYCDECIWIERGRIALEGSSLEVVKAYEEFIHKLEDRRLKAKNRKKLFGGYDPSQIDGFGDALTLIFQIQGKRGAYCDISEVSMLKDGKAEESLKVGDVQDTNWTHMSLVVLEGSNWSEPHRFAGYFCRSLRITSDEISKSMQGYIIFYSYALYEASDYAFQIRYRCCNAGKLTLLITRNGKLVQGAIDLRTDKTDWVERTFRISIGNNDLLPEKTESPKKSSDGKMLIYESSILETSENAVIREDSYVQKEGPFRNSLRSITRWPSEGSLMIEKVSLLGENNMEQAIFQPGTPLTLRLTYRAQRDGIFRVIFVAVLFRLDGVVISQNISDPTELNCTAGVLREAYLNFPLLDIGNGRYLFSVALYKTLDPDLLEEPQRYDLIDRSYEFEVVGNKPLRSAIVKLPGEWRLDDSL